jgi:hypothetical protein
LHRILGVFLAAHGHRSVGDEFEGIESQRSYAQTFASGCNKLVDVLDRACTRNELNACQSRSSNNSQILRVVGIGGDRRSPGIMSDVHVARLQSQNILIRTVELGQLRVDASFLKHSARFRQQEMGNASRRQMADPDRPLRCGRLRPPCCREQRQAGRCDRKPGATRAKRLHQSTARRAHMVGGRPIVGLSTKLATCLKQRMIELHGMLLRSTWTWLPPRLRIKPRRSERPRLAAPHIFAALPPGMRLPPPASVAPCAKHPRGECCGSRYRPRRARRPDHE